MNTVHTEILLKFSAFLPHTLDNTKSKLKVQLGTKTFKKPLHWRTSGFRFVMVCDPVLVKNVIEKVVFRIPLSNFSTTIESIERMK